MNVILSDSVEEDLEEIGDWIARDNPRRAVSFLRELRSSCADLGTSPLAFELVERFRAHGLRRRIHGSYLIFYLPCEDDVFVLRIVHGARDYEALLIEDGWFG